MQAPGTGEESVAADGGGSHMDMRDLDKVMSRRAGAAGATVAASAVPYTFQRTLMTRSNSDQALVTGLSYAIIQAIVTGLQEAIQSSATLSLGGRDSINGVAIERWSRRAITLDLAAVAGGIALQVLFQQQSGERLNRATARTVGQLLAITGSAGAASVFEFKVIAADSIEQAPFTAVTV